MEQGLISPADPVQQATEEADGTVTYQYTSTSAPVSTLSDDDLDREIGAILEVFPSFGRTMIIGHLCAQGHRVPQDRITASYLQVNGAPGVFGARQIAQKVYSVAGPNSLWHHDGQHGE